MLKHITLRGGVWPNACAASIRDLSRHLNRPSKKIAASPEPDASRYSQPPGLRYSNGNGLVSNADAADGLSTLAGAAEVHGTYDLHGTPRVPSAHGQAFHNPQSEGGSTAVAYMTPQSGYTAPTTEEGMGAAAGFASTPAGTQQNHGGYNPDFPSAPFFGQGSQPAAAAWPSDSLFDLNNVELFAGFDIPFWLDDEQYVPFLDHNGGGG